MSEELVGRKLTIAVEGPERDDVRALLRAVASWSAGLYPPESRHGLDLEAYRRPEVCLFVAREQGVALGCCAYQVQGDGSA